MRTGEVTRETKETRIHVRLNPDGSGKEDISTGVPFFDHMLGSMSRHGKIDFYCRAEGDLEVDLHHTIEDVGIVVGDAIRKAIGDGRGIKRFSHAIIPMDESLATVALDCGGRGYLVYQGCFSQKLVGGIENDIFEHFFHSLCNHGGLNAHIIFHGRNDHHQCEAVFKAFGIALGDALTITRESAEIPSTKGVL
jgi:imidazoleglycerol phosphate dehydratase HisB